MPNSYVINDRVLDPFGKNLFSEKTRFSNHLMEREVNKLLDIFDDNSIINGLDITNYSIINSNRSIKIDISPGKLIHDLTLFNFSTPNSITYNLFNYFNIVNGVNSQSQFQNYFTISGNYELDFPQFTNFSVINSINNNNDYICYNAVYSNNQTKIYTVENINNQSSSGQIVRRTVNDPNTSAKLILYTNYKYTDSFNNNLLRFGVSYIRNDGYVYGGWDHNENKIVLGVFSFETDLDHTSIIPNSLKKLEELDFESLNKQDSFTIDGKNYNVNKITNNTNFFDGGQII